MNLIKFNLVKLDRILIYQPLSISEQLNRYYNYDFNHQISYGDIPMFLRGNPELLLDKFGDEIKFAGAFLGFRDSSFKEGKIFVAKFNNNEQRDLYYKEFLNHVNKMCSYYKKVLCLQ